MVLRPLDKSVLKRLRSVVKREQVKSGRRFPKRALKVFGNLKNIDERTMRVRELGIPRGNSKRTDAWEDKMLRGPGQGMRLLRVKSGEVVIKFPTLAAKHYNLTPREEIRFMRRIVGMTNEKLAGRGFELLKPVGHQVGPFIAMRKTNFPTIGELWEEKLSSKSMAMLSRLSREMKMSEEELKQKIIEMGHEIAIESYSILMSKKLALSKNYPADAFIENKKRHITFLLKPLDSEHLQIAGQKNGVIQFVPYIDAA